MTLTWREIVPGEYWKAGPFRIELIRDYCVFKFNEKNDLVKLGWHPTLEAAQACLRIGGDA